MPKTSNGTYPKKHIAKFKPLQTFGSQGFYSVFTVHCKEDGHLTIDVNDVILKLTEVFDGGAPTLRGAQQRMRKIAAPKVLTAKQIACARSNKLCMRTMLDVGEHFVDAMRKFMRQQRKVAFTAHTNALAQSSPLTCRQPHLAVIVANGSEFLLGVNLDTQISHDMQKPVVKLIAQLAFLAP